MSNCVLQAVFCSYISSKGCSVQNYLHRASYLFCFPFFRNCHWNIAKSVTKAQLFLQRCTLTFCMNEKGALVAWRLEWLVPFFSVKPDAKQVVVSSVFTQWPSCQCVWVCWFKFQMCSSCITHQFTFLPSRWMICKHIVSPLLIHDFLFIYNVS